MYKIAKSVLIIIFKSCAEMLVCFPKECNRAYALKHVLLFLLHDA